MFLAARLLLAGRQPRILDRMPFHNEGLPSHSRQEFCLSLKATRERKGISLSQIADATKIPASLFAGLERNDLRRWPKGLFRRSFFRDYARAIGVPIAETCEEFARLFPDDSSVKAIDAAAESTDVDQQGSCVRMAFDTTWHGHRDPIGLRLMTATLDVLAVGLLTLLLMWTKSLTLSSSAAIAALAYFSLSTLIFGESAAKWAVAKRGAMGGALGHLSARVASAGNSLSGVFSSALGDAKDESSDSAEEPERRAWVSDARRVGVRVKLSP